MRFLNIALPLLKEAVLVAFTWEVDATADMRIEFESRLLTITVLDLSWSNESINYWLIK